MQTGLWLPLKHDKRWYLSYCTTNWVPEIISRKIDWKVYGIHYIWNYNLLCKGRKGDNIVQYCSASVNGMIPK